MRPFDLKTGSLEFSEKKTNTAEYKTGVKQIPGWNRKQKNSLGQRGGHNSE